MTRFHACISLLLVTSLSACAQPSQNRYNYQDVGKATAVEFGTVISEHPVDIVGPNSGIGAAAGALGGGLGGSYIGHGGGSLAGVLVGVLVGGVAGGMTEQTISDHAGIEYVITTSKGKTITIVQNVAKDDPSIRPGDRVMIQTTSHYQRVLPASHLPTKIKRPKKIEVEN